MGLSDSDYAPGDLYVFEVRLNLTDGRTFGAADAAGIITGVPAVINICVGIAMVVVGALNDEECDGDKNATYFLKVGGSVLLVSNALKLVSYLTKCECDDKIADFITPMLDFAYFIVVIWGSVLVFSAWSTIQYDDAEKDMYCPAHAFNFAFYYLVFYWIFLPLACCCGMMACCCKAFAKMSPPKGEGE
jgi:hypothetical protein